jgi:hypothetical protein
VLRVRESAHGLVLRKAGVEVLRKPLQLDASGRTTLMP